MGRDLKVWQLSPRRAAQEVKSLEIREAVKGKGGSRPISQT